MESGTVSEPPGAFSSKEILMNSCLRPAHLILAAACVCQALTASQFAHSQAAPAAAQQAQNAQHMPGNLLIYEGLVQAVGKEDDRIQSEMQAGKAQVAPRTDYAAAIGIDSDQEQALLTILLDAYRKGKEMDIESCPPHS